MRRTPHTETFLRIKVASEESFHQVTILADLLCLCAMDYNFHCHDLLCTFLVPRWYIGIIPTVHELTRCAWVYDATPHIHRL